MKVYGKWLVVQIQDGKRCIVTSGKTKHELIEYLDEHFGTNKSIPTSDYERVSFTQWKNGKGSEFRVEKNTKEYKF